MELDLTLRTGNTVRDIVVRAGDATTVAAVRAELTALAGDRGDGAGLWLDGSRLPDDASVTSSHLRSGAVVSLAGPVTSPLPDSGSTLAVVGGPHAGRTVALPRGTHWIGRMASNDVALEADADVSRVHALVEVTGAGVTVRDVGSTNGTSLDAARLHAPGALAARHVLRLGDSFLALAEPPGPPAVLHRSPGRIAVNRPPRDRRPIPAAEIPWPAAPQSAATPRLQLAAALLPAVAGLGFAWLMHSVQFLFFALLSPVMLLATAASDRLHGRRSARSARRQHSVDLAAAELAARAAVRTETDARRWQRPDPVAVQGIARLPSSRLWERRRGDDDFLSLRIGLADADSIALVRDAARARPAGRCHAVAAVVDLAAGCVGLSGPAAQRRAAARWLVCQAAVLHSPADLELAFFVDDGGHDWHWARWLPHLRGRVASARADWPEAMREVGRVVEQRRAHTGRGPARSWPSLVVIIDASATVADLPGLAGLLEHGPPVGVSVLWLGPTAAALPSGCRTVAEVGGEAGSRVSVFAPMQPAVSAVLDQVTDDWAEAVARALAPLVDVDDDASCLPQSCPMTALLADLCSQEAIAARWLVAGDGAATVIGAGVDGPVVLDLVADGPHALVGGTTGAGKSEFLQSLVVGLAMHHPPDEVSFLLVDYKGGAAFAECALLPHTVGVVTDLDHQLTRRALQSLGAELDRRERLFSAAAVADLATYRTSGPAQQVARLVIVVDEFAALAEELPDFVQGLVGIAQRGRSLGVHLVLATQRPGGVVSPEIRANATMRIALRVTDPGDSYEVIDSADAAGIDRSTPGRGYLRVGTSLTAMQTGYVGSRQRAASDDQVAVADLGAWRARPACEPDADAAESDLAVLVRTVDAAARSAGRRAHNTPWLPPLPSDIRSTDLDLADATSAGVDPVSPWVMPLGVADLPAEQRRETVRLDLDGAAALLLTGGARSGRSWGLAAAAVTAAQRLEPAQLHLYVCDLSGGLGMLRTLPHCATYAGPDQVSTSLRLIDRLGADLDRRRQQLTAWGVSSAAEARRAGHPTPQALLVVDGWEAVAAAADERDGGRTAELLLALARTGGAAGITIALAGDRATLSPRVASAFGLRIVLKLTDRADFAMAGIAPRAVPTQLPPGRGVRVSDGAEVQLALPVRESTRAALNAAVAELAVHHQGRPAAASIRLRPLPARVDLNALDWSGDALCLGVGGDEATIVRLRHGDHAQLLVAGPPRSGRSTLLRALLLQATANDLKTISVCSRRSPLFAEAERLGAPVVEPSVPLPDHLRHLADPTLLLIDDLDLVNDRPLGDHLHRLVEDDGAPLVVVGAGRSDDIATTYRGLTAALRKPRLGVLLRPGPADGEILGLRGARTREFLPPGRGIVVGDPAWDPVFANSEPVQLQAATP